MNEEHMNSSSFAIPLIIFLTVISMFFIIIIVDYNSTFTIKDTIDNEFKNIVINEMTKKLSDEHSSDYIAKFEDIDKLKLEDTIRNEFIHKMLNEKNQKITISELTISNPSDLTITCIFKGTFEFKPIIGKDILVFNLPVEAKAKVIRFDEY